MFSDLAREVRDQETRVRHWRSFPSGVDRPKISPLGLEHRDLASAEDHRETTALALKKVQELDDGTR